MLDILHLRLFDYSHIQVYSLRICSLSLVPRGSLVFSVVNLVFVLVVLSISLCKCRFLDLYSFGKSVGSIRSIRAIYTRKNKTRTFRINGTFRLK